MREESFPLSGLRLDAATLLQALPDPALLTDSALRVLVTNTAATNLFPMLKAGEAFAFAVRDPTILDAVSTVLREKRVQSVEYVERGSSGKAFLVHVSFLSGPGLPTSGGALLVLHDLTAARRIERMRVDFIANASHELRTPLTSVLGFIETLEGAAKDDAIARPRFLAVMREQAQRMVRLVDDLLSLSRVEMSTHLHPETIVDVVPLAHHMADALHAVAQKRGVHIQVEAPHEPVWIKADRDEILRLFENLIENAVRYGRSGKRVDVKVELALQNASQHEVRLRVRDYGPGIAPEHLPRLTERFYRVDPSASRSTGGTGLGLAIVKHIVSRHRGRLEIESRAGWGSEFCVRLPAFQENGEPMHRTTQSTAK